MCIFKSQMTRAESRVRYCDLRRVSTQHIILYLEGGKEGGTEGDRDRGKEGDLNPY